MPCPLNCSRDERLSMVDKHAKRSLLDEMLGEATNSPTDHEIPGEY